MTETQKRKLLVTAQLPAPGQPDMDWTEPCLELGTTFTLSGVVNAEQIPVEKAHVKDEVLHVEGHVWMDLSDP